MLKDAFLSIVWKDCGRNDLLVRARRRGDIEKVFPTAIVRHTPNSDYPFRAAIPGGVVTYEITQQFRRIDYPNFKDAVDDAVLHDAYLRVWGDMLAVMEPRGTTAPVFRPRPAPKRKVRR